MNPVQLYFVQVMGQSKSGELGLNHSIKLGLMAGLSKLGTGASNALLLELIEDRFAGVRKSLSIIETAFSPASLTSSLRELMAIIISRSLEWGKPFDFEILYNSDTQL